MNKTVQVFTKDQPGYAEVDSQYTKLEIKDGCLWIHCVEGTFKHVNAFPLTNVSQFRIYNNG